MKTSHLTAAGLLIVGSALASELAITSVERNDTVTWTNTLSNAVYQVQWSNSVTGTWTNFQALASLDAVKTTNTVVSAQVPVFYRVAAQQSARPSAAGVYRYEGYDAAGGPLSVGWLSLVVQTNLPQAEYLTGTWSLGYVGTTTGSNPTKVFGAQIGKGELSGSFDSSLTLIVNLTPNTFNDEIFVVGQLQDKQYTGSWNWQIFGKVQTNGTFSAEKLSN